MKGTEKQIAWAQDLKPLAIEAINAGMQAFTSDARYDASNPKHAAAVTLWQRRLANIERCDKAWILIDALQYLSPKHSPLENFADLNATLRLDKYFD